MNSEFLVLGKIVGAWGVKGWLKVFSYTRQKNDIADYDHWYLRPKKQGLRKSASKANTERDSDLYKVKVCRSQGQGIVAQLEGIENRDQAEALNGFELLVKTDQLPKLEQGEFYWHQLIGLSVVQVDDQNSGDDAAAVVLGKVRSMLETGANDVLIIRADEQKEDILIPYIKDDVVKKVDIEQGQIVVDWDPDY
jgi:16S rRNA processing protein RimM